MEKIIITVKDDGYYRNNKKISDKELVKIAESCTDIELWQLFYMGISKLRR